MHTQRGSAIHGGEAEAGGAWHERIAALLVTSITRAHLCDALSGAVDLQVHRSVREHIAYVKQEPPLLCVVEVTPDTASAHVEAIRLLRTGFPSVPVLAYCDPAGGTSSVIVDVVRAGATGLVLRGIDDSRVVLREAMQRARRSPIAERIFAEIAPLLTTDARVFLRYAIAHAAVDVSVEAAARDLGIDRKTLTNWLARAGAPRAREFMTWVRLTVAAHALSDPKRSAERVALSLDFPSGASLRNMVRRYVGLTTAELQHEDGVSLVLGAFAQHVRDERAALPLPVGGSDRPDSAHGPGAMEASA